MKRYITCVSVLLFAGLLVSCGGGGGDGASAGGSPASADGASAPANNGGTPPAAGGGTPPAAGGGTTPPATGGGAGPLPSAGAHVEESDAAVTLSTGWTKSNLRYGWSDGLAMQSGVAGATASFSFTGTSVRWIGRRDKESGVALVRIDGGPPRRVDLFARAREIRTPVLTIYGLSPGNHSLTIEVTGEQNELATSNVVVVDAFEVDPPIVSRFQDTDPNLTFTAAWVQADPAFSWSGCCVVTPGQPTFGGARVAETAGENATLEFRGTSIKLIGYRGPDAGIARVRVDGGAVSQVDLYSPAAKVQEVVFTATGLADTTHTLTVEATGLKRAASTRAQVVVDAFDVTTPGRRYQESDPSIIYTGRWVDNVNRPWSEGVSKATERAGARATFSFTGTSVSYIGVQKRGIGPARIYIDGAFVEEVKNRRDDGIEGYQYTIFRADGLTNGPHTIAVEATLDDGHLVVDAFDVHP